MVFEEPAVYTASTLGDIGTVRHDLVSDLLAIGMSAARIDDAVVVASELIANVLVHTTSTASVTVTAEAERLCVGVADDSSEMPDLQPADPARVGGNGLRIVDDFAEAWGATPVPDHGKIVWFTVRQH